MSRGAEGHAPAGWPAQVRPPGAPDWEETAIAWLLDLCPPEHRRYEVLRRHPAALARMAREHVSAGLEALRQGYATARADLAALGPETVTAVLDVYVREGRRLRSCQQAVVLVEQALQGQRFTPKL